MFLRGYKANERSRSFNEISELKEWIDKHSGEYKWNIILAGLSGTEKGVFSVSENITVSKVERSAIHETIDDQIQLKSLSSPTDRYADAKLSELTKEQIDKYDNLKKDPSEEWRNIRKLAKINETPALIIYCISKDSRPERKGRHDLDAKDDIIGISVIMPGFEGKKGPTHYQIKSIKKRENEDGYLDTQK
jgi:hypothetical protein